MTDATAHIDAPLIATLTDAERRRIMGLLMAHLARGPKKGKWVGRLEAMAVGDSFITLELGPNHSITASKRSARTRMGCPDAQWRATKTSKGLRITRTA